MISNYGERVLKTLKAVDEKTEKKDLFTLKQMMEQSKEAGSIMTQAFEDVLRDIEGVLQFIESKQESSDGKFTTESLTLTKEFISKCLAGESFSTDSYVEIMDFARILIRQIHSGYTYQCYLVGMSPI